MLRRESTKSERRRSNLLRQHEDQFLKQCPFTPKIAPPPSYGRSGGKRGRGRTPRYSNEIAADRAAALEAAEAEAAGRETSTGLRGGPEVVAAAAASGMGIEGGCGGTSRDQINKTI